VLILTPLHSLFPKTSKFYWWAWIFCRMFLFAVFDKPDFVPMFRRNESRIAGAQYLLDSSPLKTEQMGYPITSVRNYHHSLRNNPEERSFQPSPIHRYAFQLFAEELWYQTCRFAIHFHGLFAVTLVSISR